MYADKELCISAISEKCSYGCARVNKSCQSKTADPVKLLKDLTLLMSTLVKKITLPTVKVDPFENDIKDFIDFKAYLGF